MLKVPSVVLNSAAATTKTKYAHLVYHALLQAFDSPKEKDGQLFVDSFVDVRNAHKCKEDIRDRLLMEIDKDNKTEVDYYFLAPIFLRSNRDFVVEVSDDFVVVMSASGPVVPIVRCRRASTANSRARTSPELLDYITAVYELYSEEFITDESFKSLLSRQLV